MVDFSHLKKKDVTAASLAEYVFEDIDGEPSIICAPASDANAAFTNESIRMQIEETEQALSRPTKRGKARYVQTPAEREEEREKDRHLIARFCAVRWGTAPVDVNGAAPEFTPDNCYDFLKALPNWMLDPFRSWDRERPQLRRGDAGRSGRGA